MAKSTGHVPAPRSPTRPVACTWCGREVQAAPSAKSMVCPHCNKRLVVEDIHTTVYHAVRHLATCGDVVVEKPGHLVATVQAANLTVAGKLTGNASARGRVIIRSTAQVRGDIRAPRLRVESGATLVGNLRIGAADAPGSDTPPGLAADATNEE
ncbi:MAG: polymer-forming cytoskeletal protein [Phycisphaerae bacterium]|nr:polymer-forming cytoskeletal protein [Phycisphaerae bacterium]MCZ2401009.1 polymer-forming cytoskeletal protein [Phycisphaerae bacterium]